MALSETQAGRVRALLAELGPATRAALAAALRNDGADALHAFLLGELRALDGAPPRIPRTPRELLFAPLEPFVVEETAPTKIAGRIARPALDAVWTLIEREVAPEAVRAAGSGSPMPQDDAAEGFVAAVRAGLDALVSDLSASADLRRKIAARVGGKRHLAEIGDIATILAAHRDIEAALAELPPRLDCGDAGHARLVLQALDAAAGAEPPIAGQVAARIHARWADAAKVPSFAAASAGSDDPKLVGATPVAPFVDLVLGDIETLAERAVAALDRRDLAAVPPLLRGYNSAARAFRAALDFDKRQCDWGDRLTAARRRLSDRLGDELGGLAAALRRSVRSLRAFGSRRPTAPDPLDVEAACALILLHDATRSAAAELALNELVLPMRADTEAYLDTCTAVLMQELRAEGAGTRPVLLAHAGAAVRIAETLFGATQAGLLRKGFEIAAGAPLPEVPSRVA